MKMIIAYVNPERLWELKKRLFEIRAPGLSVDNFMGIGKPLAKHREMMEKYGAIPKFFPKTRIEIVAPDDMVEDIVNAIVEVCRTGHPGDGKIFILPVEDAVRIRTGERKDKAL